jgi:8-oxo-dGTP pyrophosphatase MutT (NUDIX family)
VIELPVPEDDLPRVRAVLAGDLEPPAPRPAVSVVLAHDGAEGIEVHLLRRHPALVFAPGRFVFPGGGVEESDARPAPWLGAPPARPELVVAGVRETFEECGVLLAVGDAVPDLSWEPDRVALERGDLALADLLDARGLALEADMLVPLAHWVTPIAERRRFDAQFFLAGLPVGQETRDIPGESDLQVWIRPADALARGLSMMPPTRALMRQLATETTVADALARPREIQRIQPEVRMVGDRVELVLPE